MIVYLIVAWILSWFGFDEICITALNELFGISISSASYYFVFAVLGYIASCLEECRKNDIDVTHDK